MSKGLGRMDREVPSDSPEETVRRPRLGVVSIEFVSCHRADIHDVPNGMSTKFTARRQDNRPILPDWKSKIASRICSRVFMTNGP